MNPQDPLANLQPLREPALIGWWPLAPGWWVLLALVLLLLAALVYWLLKRYRSNAYRRLALKQLDELQKDNDKHRGSGAQLEAVNALLKSVALVAYPRHDIAALHSSTWLEFLNQRAAPGEAFQASFGDALYRKDIPDVDIAQVHRAARYWIKHHRGRV